MYNEKEYHRKLMNQRRKDPKTRHVIQKSNQRWKYKKQIVLAEFKAAVGCTDCSETDAVVLDFDHRDPRTKKRSISDLIWRGASWIRIFEELVKCDVRCANCHRRMTAKRRQDSARLV